MNISYVDITQCNIKMQEMVTHGLHVIRVCGGLECRDRAVVPASVTVMRLSGWRDVTPRDRERAESTSNSTFDRRASNESYRICISLTILINKFIQYFNVSPIIIIKNSYK